MVDVRDKYKYVQEIMKSSQIMFVFVLVDIKEMHLMYVY